MNTTLHLAPEEIMAFLDGELSSAEAQEIKAHLATCPNCSVVAAQFQETAQMLAVWEVPTLPDSRENSISKAIKSTNLTFRPTLQTARRRWMTWGLSAVGAVLVVALINPILNSVTRQRQHSMYAAHEETIAEAGRGGGHLNSPAAMKRKLLPSPPPPPLRSQASPLTLAPQIARTVSLTLKVVDVTAARSRVDAILALHQGYAARLSVANGTDSHSFSGSLRIPVAQLDSTLSELKSIGSVQSEEQNGEDVTQQHVDLDARLRNARETEDRLRSILAQRTGSMSDVLEVEEQISQEREQIEQMETEQQELDHRITFATVDLVVAELDHETQNTFATRLHQSLSTGWHDAAAMLVAIVLFLAEDGPSILIWLAFLSIPGFFLWRRYKRLRGQE